jgi:hypothetical protein
MIDITQNETHIEAAMKIWKFMEIGECVEICGFSKRFESSSVRGSKYTSRENGKLVLSELERLYLWNHSLHGKGKVVKTVRPPWSVGGTLAHKIFRYKRLATDEEIKWYIWRIQ